MGTEDSLMEPLRRFLKVLQKKCVPFLSFKEKIRVNNEYWFLTLASFSHKARYHTDH